jgi:hypothetical protein
MKWTRRSGGYASECGRFKIRNVSMTTRARWVLFDTHKKDAVLSGENYDWSIGVTTLASGKRKAEKLANGTPHANV